MEFGCFLTVILILCVLWLCYRYLSSPYDYWEKQGVPSIPAVPILGSMLPVFIQDRHTFQFESYKKYGRIFGHYESTTPVLNVGDPDLLRHILLKDFHVFPNQMGTASNDALVAKSLLQLRGEDWKRVRSILTPVFTSGKLKKMVSIMADSARTLMTNFDDVAQSKKPADVKNYFGAYSLDVIASCVFATKFDSFNDPENVFVAEAKRVLHPVIPWRVIISRVFPVVRKLFGISFMDAKGVKFFRDVIMKIIEQRKKTGEKRDDFLQMLIEIAVGTYPSADERNGPNEVSQRDDGVVALQQSLLRGKDLTMDELVDNCIIFFFAGYDTTASALSFLAYSLALNPDIQEKLLTEVDEITKKHNGEITYETLQDLQYMDMVINETLRMYPISPYTGRQAAENYKLGDTGITIPKDMAVLIPVYSIHHDPELYPDPEKFDPERFSNEEKAKRKPFVYLPFGAGPRSCIGMRFAVMEIKIALVYILRRFVFKKCSQTKVPLEYRLAQLHLTPKDITLSVEVRDKKYEDIPC